MCALQAVSFVDVPEKVSGGATAKGNTFSIILDKSGDIMLWYKVIAMSTKAVIGLSPGPDVSDGSDEAMDFTADSVVC